MRAAIVLALLCGIGLLGPAALATEHGTGGGSATNATVATGGSASTNASAGVVDLVVAAVARSPENATEGERVTFRATVRNVGSVRANASVARLEVEDRAVADAAVPALGAGASVDVAFAWNATPGAARAAVVADADDDVPEASEANNRLLVRLTVAERARARLALDAVATDPVAPGAGDVTRLTVRVRNEGTAVARNASVRIAIDGARLEVVGLGAVPPGGTANASWTWIAARGARDVRVEAAADDAAGLNVTRRLDVGAGRPADLVVERVILPDRAPRPGDAVDLAVVVTNRGPAGAPNSTLLVAIDSKPLARVPVPSLVPNGSARVNVTWNATHGPHVLTVLVDALSAVAESNETDNARSAAFRVAFPGEPLPDLVVESMLLEDRAVANRTLRVRVTVRNAGDGPSGVATLALAIDGEPASFARVKSLRANESATALLAWAAPEGSRAVAATVDADHGIGEAREGNNEGRLRVAVQAPAPPTANITLETVPGPPWAWRATVRNSGDAPIANASVRFGVNGVVVGEVPLPTIPPGASANVTSPRWAPPRGVVEAFVIAYLDAGGNATSEVASVHVMGVEEARRVPAASAPVLALTLALALVLARRGA